MPVPGDPDRAALAISARICSAAVYVFPLPGGPCSARTDRRAIRGRTAAALAVSPSARSDRRVAPVIGRPAQQQRGRRVRAACPGAHHPVTEIAQPIPLLPGPGRPRLDQGRGPRPGVGAAHLQVDRAARIVHVADRPLLVRAGSSTAPPETLCSCSGKRWRSHHRLPHPTDQLAADQAAQRVRLAGQFGRGQRRR